MSGEAPEPGTVIDNRAQSRFELVEDGKLAFATYRRQGDDLIIPHVEAALALRGRGTAGRLMEGVVAIARQEGLKIVPLCSYASLWFRRHKDEADVLR
jgi:predicted GNAT family acetyltransferase